MFEQSLPPDGFKERFHASLERERLNLPALRRVAKHQPVYMCGDTAETVYFIESGQVKLLMLSPEGKECLLAIYTSGDIFGELCLAEGSPRQELAMAMEDTTLRRVPFSSFFCHLSRNDLVEGFVDYLAARVADQQHLIANLITVDSKHRLGKTLLFLARKLGQPNSHSTQIELKITHDELAMMVGTTRPRITKFMQEFRARDLIEVTPDHFLIVKESKLSDYLARSG
jgi:CRP/FNR family cyclic AMP-dependent transcriptional regulator